MIDRLWICVLLGLVSHAVTTAANGQPPAADGTGKKATESNKQDRPAVLKTVVAQLEAEAREIEVWKTESKVAPVFSRPHEKVRELKPEDIGAILRRMRQPLTGQEYRDSYIRWHLMHVVRGASGEQLAKAVPILVDLVNEMPEPLVGAHREEHRYVPKKNYQMWHRLYHTARATKGYPPFQQVIYGPAALPLMSPAERPQAEANLKLAAKIKFKHVVDKKVQAYNTRIRWLNSIVRQYRGDLIYCLVRSGDSQVLSLVAKAIEKNVRKKRHIAFDLVAYVYQATFHGAMAQYDESTRLAFADHLKRVARQHQRYVDYGGTKRNFADYAFHLIELLQQPEKL
ncbi:MAG: hypothetical protein CMJ49_02890 [Planctomycetaceae bacterium]|nr:hypothetical protein [Planctomycetaceae bacterium]